ncbi:MAG: mechanosensitive ion channel [Trueperaceae bacterium]|nr:mechanosensitive ion channel [Trueperaceae bacterium]
MEAPTTTDVAGWIAALESWSSDQPFLATLVAAGVVALVAWVAYAVTRRYLIALIERVTRRTPFAWDEALHERHVFRRVARIVPILVVQAGLRFLPALDGDLENGLRRALAVAAMAVFASGVGAALGAVGDLYQRTSTQGARPIKGYLQAASLVVYGFVVVVAAATLLGRDPLVVLGGLGAASAVLLLIFRDTILSLVAGIQLTSNDLIRVGDWIEMPQFDADGDVVDVALNTVKVQNWDRTFTVIPTHRFLEQSFTNWRGMQDSGGRRIKRSLLLDQHSVRFLEPTEIDDARRFALLRDYLDAKQRELDAWNAEHPEAGEEAVNARRLTNLGTFRAYVVAYLRSRPDVRQDMTFLVRQLDPTAHGVPLEVYVFAATVEWGEYEGIQSDVFDHLLAIVSEFGLRVFQQPSGSDLRALAGTLADRREPPRRPAGEGHGGRP